MGDSFYERLNRREIEDRAARVLGDRPENLHDYQGCENDSAKGKIAGLRGAYDHTSQALHDAGLELVSARAEIAALTRKLNDQEQFFNEREAQIRADIDAAKKILARGESSDEKRSLGHLAYAITAALSNCSATNADLGKQIVSLIDERDYFRGQYHAKLVRENNLLTRLHAIDNQAYWVDDDDSAQIAIERIRGIISGDQPA